MTTGFLVKSLTILVCLFALLSITTALSDALISTERASLDLQWDAARVLLNRQNPYALAIAGQPPPADSALPDLFEPNQFPSALLILTPYAMMPWPVAKTAWAITNLVATIAIGLSLFILFAPRVPAVTRLGVIAIWVSGYTWRLHTGLGQHTLFSLACFLLALWAARERRPLLSGALLALALLKYTTVIPLCLFFLWGRQWKPLVLALSIHVSLHLGLSLWLNEPPLALLVQPLQLSQRLADAGGLDLFALARTTGILSRLGFASYDRLIAAGLAGLLLLAVGALPILNRHALPTPVYLALLAMVANVVVYHRLYDHITLIVSLVAFAATARPSLSWVPLYGALLLPFVLINYLHPLWPANPPPLYLCSLVVIYYSSIGVLIWACLRVDTLNEPAVAAG